MKARRKNSDKDKARTREWKKNNRVHVNAYNRRKFDERKARGLCTRCGKDEAVPGKVRCSACAVVIRDIVRRTKDKLRDEVFRAYGGYCCACCGETERRFLSIDHVNGGGQRHRKAIGGGSLYTWLRVNGFPPGFQVLCHNCNLGKTLNRGICPHQPKRAGSPPYQALTWPC
jgi:hypothetical protein